MYRYNANIYSKGASGQTCGDRRYSRFPSSRRQKYCGASHGCCTDSGCCKPSDCCSKPGCLPENGCNTACGCQPVTCRPCCCPACIICCCGRPSSPAPAPSFSVTYDPNGGSGGITDSGIASGTQYTIKTLAETGTTRTGYTFTGWNTAANGNGTSYQPGAEMTVSGNVTLYAQWTPETETYTVSYEANGGTGEYNDPDVASGTQYTVKTLAETGITRAGYTFTGWNTAAGGTGMAYAPSSTATINGNLTLYAQWTPASGTYTVTYNANEGTGTYSDSDIASGSQYQVKTNTQAGITRTGYTFTGWNTAANGSGTSYQPGAEMTVSGNVTLYAQWTPAATYTVTYNANGGTGEYSDSGIAAGSSYTVKSPAEMEITNTGNVFTGWNTAAGGGGTGYQPDESITVNGNITLYAQWTPARRFSVSYSANGGTGEYTDSDIEEGTKYTVKTQAATGINKAGSTFTGWNTVAAGTGTEYQPESTVLIENNLTLYAQWTP